MKRNLLYIYIIIFLLLLILALVLTIIYLKKRPKIILPSPIVVEKEVIAGETKTESEIQPTHPEFLRYGIKPKEAKYYD